MNIEKELFLCKEDEYASFIAKLNPTVDRDSILGVRLPKLREIAKQYKNDLSINNFLGELPHKYYEENLIHSILLNNIKDYDFLIKRIEDFMPYIDNWAVGDTIHPKALNKNIDDLVKHICKWCKSKETYTVRLGITLLMDFCLDEHFKKEYLNIIANINSEEYYVKIAQAWFFATALAKQWDTTIIYIKDNKLSTWVHNKSIQKSIESFRISGENKQYLRTLKR